MAKYGPGVILPSVPDPNPLSGAWRKLSRAEQHLRTLHEEVRPFIDGRPYGVIPKLDLERSRCVFVVAYVEEPPRPLSLIFGDYVHNLRCALDHLAWQLALLNYNGKIPREVWRQIQFPIAPTRAEVRETVAAGHLAPAHRALIEEFYPAQRQKHSLLPLIGSLDNADKHRELHPTVVTLGDELPRFSYQDAAERAVWAKRGKPLKVETKIACVEFQALGPNPDVQMDTLPITISFGQAADKSFRSFFDVVADIIERCQVAFFS